MPVLTIYVLNLNVDGQPVPQYTNQLIQEGPYEQEVADFRAKEILANGIHWGNLYFPAHRVQRVQVYDSTPPH